MNSRAPSLARLCAALLPVLLLVVLASSAAAVERNRRYPERIPARRVSPEVLRRTEKGRALLQREELRAQALAERWGRVHDMLGARQVSRKSLDLLRRRGLGPELLQDRYARAGREAPQAFAVDTLRIILVRMSFESNRRPGLTTIPVDGNFMLEPVEPPTDGSFLADPPPHDRAYFESHLSGLSEFYKFQSGGRLHIVSTVLPEGDTDSYRVRDVADYGPGAGNFWNIDGLERFVRDMIHAADEGMLADDPFGDGTTLADFDDDDPFTYVVFVHAGSDWQSDINGNSPNDPPTFFFDLGTPEALMSSDGETGAAGSLSEASVIPETTSQDGYQGSIAAALNHEFGHALGLVDIYSTGSGATQVGPWDLMDAGTNLAAVITSLHVAVPGDTAFVQTVVTGALPPSLGAWSKWYLGWVHVQEMRGEEREYRLPAVQVPRESDSFAGGPYLDYEDYPLFDQGDPQVLRAGASPRDFFLLENRWVPISAGETPFDALFFQSDPATGVILYLGGEFQGLDVNSGLYDFFMPAGGLLVWHVNRDRIDAGLGDNTINIYEDGLRLVEADGISDIGVADPHAIGRYGSALDPFAGYWVELDENFNPIFHANGFTELFADGAPSTRAWDRSWTGVALRNARTYATGINGFHGLILFDGRVHPLVGGSPCTLPPLSADEAAALGGRPGPRGLEPASLVPLPVAGPPAFGIVDRAPADWDGDTWQPVLFALSPDGRPRYVPQPDLPAGGIARLPGPLAGSPVSMTGTAGDQVIFGTVGGEVLALRAQPGGLPSWAWSTAAADTLLHGPIPGGGTDLLLSVASDRLLLIGEDGSIRGEPLALREPGGTPVSRLAGNPLPAPTTAGSGWVVPADRGWFSVAADATGLLPDPAYHPYSPAVAESTLVRAALIHESHADRLVVFADKTAQMWIIEDGETSGPLPWPGGPSEPLVCEPAVADLDGNGRNDLIFLTATRVHACQADGTPISGFPLRATELFPLPDSTRIAGPLVVMDADGDRADEIYLVTSLGHLIGLESDGRLVHGTPFLWGDLRTADLSTGNWTTADGHRILWLLDAGGDVGPPLGRRSFNGRITGLALPGGFHPDGGTSEWRAAGGGFARLGPVGVPVGLGASAPLQAVVNAGPIAYPNPLRESDVLTIRFFSAGGATARFALFDLEGQMILTTAMPAIAGQVTEHPVSLPRLASGLYVCRLEHDARGASETTVWTLAVER